MSRTIIFAGEKVTITMVDGTRIVRQVLALSTFRRLFG
jgi:hypothetical protein